MMPLKVEFSSMLKDPAHQSPVAAGLLKTNGALVQQIRLLMEQSECIERRLRCMELFALIGPPPGLTQPQPELLKASADASRSKSTDSFPCSSQNSDRPFEIMSQESQTTLMIRNIVGHCTRNMLLDFIDRKGFHGRYTLLYLPQRFAGKGCFHHAFVDFVGNDAAMEFQTRLNGCSDEDLFGDKSVEISWSQCQGLEANIEKFRNSSVMHPSVEDECRPILFKDGNVVPFPKPTRKLKLERRNRKEAEDCKA
jgi:hypothetical protein